MTDAIERCAREWRHRDWRRLTMNVYLAGVIVAGVAALGWSIRSLIVTPLDLRWFVLAALAVASGQLMLRMPVAPVSFSISEIFTITAALLFGPAVGTVVVAIEAAALSAKLVDDKRSLTRYLFNLSAAALAMLISGRVFFALSRTSPFASDPSAIIDRLGPLTIFAGLYFALNTGLVALAVALATRRTPWHVWRSHFLSLWPGYVGGASAAGLTIFLMAARNGDLRVLAFVLPIPLLLYFAFRTAVARMQDSVGHLTRVNSMYLATIETLAQAVDARDQVTHDHIRRVQRNAMRLARELDVSDEAELRALEAAALLHDTGKLAIPEHILNKPDKLTPAEFETMKQHARIGAEILSPIGFPFPVVPIVRHHHENWDGTGYPDGLHGEQIPIGARVLSVVDCFDALTSDRPYRRAYTAERALQVIRERRGVMYDPAVVDALLRISDEIECERIQPADSLGAADPGGQPRRASPMVQSTDPAITIMTVNMAGQLGAIVGRQRDLGTICEALYEQLSMDMPGLTIVLYQYDPHLDALFVRAASGVHKAAVQELTIGVGTRLTGWVAAHRKTIVNSEAALDLGNMANQLRPLPQRCLSTPLTASGQLAGVLTIYSTLDRAFTPNDTAIFEMLAALLGPLVAAGAPRARHPVGVASRSFVATT